MKEVEVNKSIKLSPHFTLGEMTKTSYHPLDGNIPSRVHIENLRRLCGWLEMLRSEWNKHYGEGDDPIIINSGFRSPDTNQLCGGAKNSNHLTGCAVDIHCAGKEQAIRYACILLDIADGKKQDFDELILEKRGTTIWVHFAVRPRGNRRYVHF
ncbi:MAG: D-Ala-D-Ala carboxypeptidase family metallohydrolase [Prevotella sp.]|nr:D-Ala-D-Ala carboxypeptidase family metallohydrolase [Prevotella sp.]